MPFEEFELCAIALDGDAGLVDGPFGSNLPASDYVEEGIPVIRGSNLSKGEVRFKATDFVFVSEATAERLERSICRPRDIIFTKKGTLGQVGIVPAHPFERYLLSSNQMRLRVDEARANPDYVYYVLSTAEMIARIIREAEHTGVPKINLTYLRRFRIPLPSRDVQDQICGVVSSIDDRIDLLHQTNTTLESIAQALFKSWFIDFDPVRAKAEGREPEGMDVATAALFPAEFQDSALGLIPKGWSPACLGDVADVIDCLHSKKPELLDEGRPYLQLNNIRDDGLLDASTLTYVSVADYAKWTSRIEVREGDCVITNVGRVGAVSQVPPGLFAAMGRNMTAIRLRSQYPYPTFLIELLLSPWMRAEIERRTDVGTILNALNVRSIPRLQFVQAPHSVLNAAESLMRPLRAAMESNIKRAAHLAMLRDTLLPRLISGRLRLPEVQEELEDALA